jgi:NAD(P)-dependent dehydrogenase (short-subunit alcohol dehydrogenase family)
VRHFTVGFILGPQQANPQEHAIRQTLDDFKYHGMSSSLNHSGMRDMLSRYAVSKLANILFAKELQRRLDEDKIPIISTTCNPGATNTEGGLSVFPGVMRPILSRVMATPVKAAITILYLACAPEIKRDPAKYKAQYYNSSGKLEAPSAPAQDKRLAKNLWKTSEGAVGEYLRS